MLLHGDIISLGVGGRSRSVRASAGLVCFTVGVSMMEERANWWDITLRGHSNQLVRYRSHWGRLDTFLMVH